MKYQYDWAYPDMDEFMAGELKADGSYQSSHLTAALAYVQDFSCAIDGGAHVGTWSRPMSQRFAQVIAVEPSADTYACLVRNLEHFGITNVDARHLAIGASAGRVSMTLSEKEVNRKNTGARYALPGDEVACETIDSWHLPSLGFLKLDIEGSEVAALEGARETLRRCRPIVLFEDKAFWKRYGLRRDAPQQVLLSLGYQHLQRVSMDEIWGPL